MNRSRSRAPVSIPAPVTASVGQTLKEGFALGAGQAVAHRIVGSFFSTPVVPTASQVAMPLPKPPQQQQTLQEQAWFQCLKENNFSRDSEVYCAHLKPNAVDVEKL